ncbi:hypothetical protein TNCV_3535121 [Trichonephila clavipes]|nr:hypothetical protein TNCV_3535121 [Trichonephila clavipes]
MTLHSPTENSLAVLNHKILEANSRSKTIYKRVNKSFDYLRRLVETTAQFRKEKVSSHGSIPITIDCNVVAFIVLKKDSNSILNVSSKMRQFCLLT